MTKEKLQLWHGSSCRRETFEGDALTGTIHLGSLAQAAMRSGGKHLHLLEISMPRLKRVRDQGHDRADQIRKARAAGYDGLVYLNRYEGIEVSSIEAALAKGPGINWDRISDAAFRKLFPEASDSYLSFDPHHCKLLGYFETRADAQTFLDDRSIAVKKSGNDSGIWHVGIDYDEGDPDSYRAVTAKQGDETRRFEGQGPQEDWAAYRAWAHENQIMTLTLSSVTHFCWDVPGWRFVEDECGAEILVPEDRPGFDEPDPGI